MKAEPRWLLAVATLSLSLLDPSPSRATKEIGTTAEAFTLTSSKFEHQAEIPAVYTCDGSDMSPPLQWTGVPAKTQSLALVLEDPDATEPPRRMWTHWVVFNIPPITHALHESVRARRDLPRGAREGTNDWQRVGYSGPCPPSGRKHHYLFKLFALDVVLDLEAPTQPDLEREMHGHVLARAELIGTYERKK
jgi:Raf kinase inhibitor-like YbhB/YbcL family protein